MMDLNQELIFFALLMEITAKSIGEQWPIFNVILHKLFVSHTQAYFEVDAANKAAVIRFADWLESLAQKFDDPMKRALLMDRANHFRVDPST